MNTDSILNQFGLVDQSIHRAKLTFETGMIDKNNIEVALYELIKAQEQIANMVREIAPDRFGISTVSITHTPELDVRKLYTCLYCGSPECESDHK
jgi:hypothetical protein